MKVKQILAAVVTAMSVAVMATTASNGPIVPGQWNSNFAAAKQYAEANGIPMLLFWGSRGCGYCQKMQRAVDTATFQQWQAAANIVMVFCEDVADAKNFARNATGKYPYMAFYLPKSGTVYKFSGRTTSPELSATPGGTLEAKLINLLNNYIGSTPGPGPVTPTVGEEWNSARKLYAAVRDGNDSLLGILEIKTGKVSKSGSKKGKSKIAGKFMTLAGKSKSFRSAYATVDTETFANLNGTAGSLNLIFKAGGIAPGSTMNGNPVSATNIGDGVADGVYTFEMLPIPSECEGKPTFVEYLTPQPFSSNGNRWTFSRKGSLKYNRGAGAFVMSSLENPSGLKLSYKMTKNSYKGSFTVYARKSDTTVKRYTAKVTGYMINGLGEGEVEIRRVGNFGCQINKQ